MRVGVDYRILTGGRSAATRGMPRYTQQQLREVLAAGSDHEYLLLCDARTDQTLILPEIRSAPNVEVRVLPAEATTEVGREDQRLHKAEIFESWLAAQQLDVYHCTTPFFLDQLIVDHHDACPYVATVYDLIPLIYPAQYLAPPELRRRYLRATEIVTRATRLLAISAAAGRDASLYLGVPEERIDVAQPFAEPVFRPMSAGEVATALAPLADRIDVRQPYVLSVADLHFTKNLETLVRAYAQLPPAIRRVAPLVVVCDLSDDDAAYLARLAGRLGVGDGVRPTGLVQDRQLAALYNGATFVVHPSRYEGFGLPVLEAMQCGTPVITTTSSSLPEVAGDACVLFDPDDAPALAAAMERVWDDPTERDRMRERGLERASAYSGAALAGATLAAYARALDRRWDVQSASPVADVRLNRVCEIKDISESGSTPESWRTAMALRALEECGALGDDAVILGVGAGTGEIAFHLTRHVAKVIVTDRYLRPRAWSAAAPPAMLCDPSSAAPFPFDGSRLLVRHMDGRVLGFGDDTFDGAYSSGSIQHVGELEDIASAAYEIGRVLKPGGVLSLSTDLLLTGPPGGRGIPGTPLLSSEQVQRYLIEASGLEPVDELRLSPSPATLGSPRDLSRPESRHVIRVADGYVYCAVHLALRKTERYPLVPNAWARPSPALRRTVEAEIRQVVATAPVSEAQATPEPVGPAQLQHTVPRAWPAMAAFAERLAATGGAQQARVSEGMVGMAALHAQVDANVAALRAAGAHAVACIGGIDETRPIVAAVAEQAAVHGAGWRWCHVNLPGVAEIGVMVDLKDEAEQLVVAAAELDWPALSLLRDLVRAGDVVVDIGAGTGLFTLAAAAMGCRVVSLEPSPAKVALLRASVAGNGFFDVLTVNMSAIEAAVDVLLGELGVDTVALVRVSAGNADVPALLGMYNVLVGPSYPWLLLSSAGTEVGAELESWGLRLVRLDGHNETEASVYLAVHGSREPPAHLELMR